MTKKLKAYYSKNRNIVLVMSLPLLMTLVMAIIFFVPSIFIKPAYDFIYWKCDSGYCYDSEPFSIENGRVTQNKQTSEQQKLYSDPYNADYDVYTTYTEPEPELFYYSVETGKSRPIDLEDAQNYTMIDDDTSPDGFRLSTEMPGIWSDYKVNLLKGTVTHQTDLEGFYWDNGFLGWVDKE